MVKYIEKHSVAKKIYCKNTRCKKKHKMSTVSWQNGIKALRIQKYSLSEFLLLTAKFHLSRRETILQTSLEVI